MRKHLRISGVRRPIPYNIKNSSSEFTEEKELFA